jgi:hypothetical protein
VIELQDHTFISFDKDFYEQYAELRRAGANTSSLMGFDSKGDSPNLGKWAHLSKGSRVRVLSTVPDGAKVMIERATEPDLLAGLDQYKATKKPGQKLILKDVTYLKDRIAYIYLKDISR